MSRCRGLEVKGAMSLTRRAQGPRLQGHWMCHMLCVNCHQFSQHATQMWSLRQGPQGMWPSELDHSERPDAILFPPSILGYGPCSWSPKGQACPLQSPWCLRPGYDFSYPPNIPAHCTGILCRESQNPSAHVLEYPHWPPWAA